MQLIRVYSNNQYLKTTNLLHFITVNMAMQYCLGGSGRDKY